MYYEAGSPAAHAPIVEEWLKAWASNWSLHPDAHFAVRESSRFSLLLVENPICDSDNLREALETFLQDSIEYLARAAMRELLYEHYMDGLEHGELVERWLRDHKGWYPDQQERWDHPLPKDEGIERRSDDPKLAIREAFRIIHLVLASQEAAEDGGWDRDRLNEFLGHVSKYFKYLAAFLPDVGEPEQAVPACRSAVDVQPEPLEPQVGQRKRPRPSE